VNEGEINWFVQYDRLGNQTWGSLSKPRKYRAYWYSPNGRLYLQRDFAQTKGRTDLAKTNLQWDPALGKYVLGKWLMRVFQDGEMLDERMFEVVA